MGKVKNEAQLAAILGANAEAGWQWLWDFASGKITRTVEKVRQGEWSEDIETPNLSDRLKVMMYLMDHYVGKPVSRLEVEPVGPQYDVTQVRNMSDTELNKLEGLLTKFNAPQETVEALPAPKKLKAPK